jgi:hypothetical protein
MELALSVIGLMARSLLAVKGQWLSLAGFQKRAGGPEVLFTSPLLGPLWNG